MIIYIIIAILIISVCFYIFKQKKQFKIKDYSSDKLQNRTLFSNLGGFSFNDKTVPKEQTLKDIQILKNILVNAKLMPSEKRKWIKKLIKSIQNKNIHFNNLNYENAINIINLNLDDIADLVMQNKFSIFKKIFLEETRTLSPQLIEDAKNYGMTEEDLKKGFSKNISRELIKQKFINDEQYKILESFIKSSDFDCQKDVDKLAKKFSQILNDNQKEEIIKNNVDYKDLAQYFIYYGQRCLHRISNLKTLLPEKYFYEQNRSLLVRILTGIDTIKDGKIIKDVKLDAETIKFVPTKENDNKLKKIIKNILYINVFKDHNQILDTMIHVEKRYLKIPKILVNFDLQPDIYTNKQILNQNVANWINIAVKKYNINEIYWVIPSTGLFDQFYLSYYFEENTLSKTDFIGNFNINKVYKDLRKPLTQTVLFDISTGNIDSDSVKCTKEEFNKQIKSGKFKKLTIHICTSSNLPKINKDCILSVDGDYFNNCGYESEENFESIPFNQNEIYNDFLTTYIEKIQKARIIGLSLSPEYVGFDAIGYTRGFYEYLLTVAKENSNNIY